MRNVVRHVRWLGADMEGTGPLLGRAIGNRHALMLAQVFEPGLDQEGLEPTTWICRILE